MVKKQDENQAGNGQNSEKNQNGQQKPDQQVRARNNNQGYNQNQRGQNQFRQHGGGQTEGTRSQAHKEGQNGSQNQAGQGNNQAHNQFQPRNNVQGSRNQSERQEGFTRENNPNRHFRDRNKERDNDRDGQQRQYGSPAGGRFGNGLRIRADETIDDIKEDIIRLEKEIELEIKEIRSLKL